MIDSETSYLRDENRIDVAPRVSLLFNGLAVTAATLAVLLPLVVAGFWLFVADSDIRQMTGLTLEVLPEIAMAQRLTAAAIASSAILPLAWALTRLRVCILGFSRGKPFTARGIRGLRDFGFGALLASFAQLVSHAALSWVLTANAAAGSRSITLGVSSDMLLLALFAVVVLALVWAMERAAAIADENSQFI